MSYEGYYSLILSYILHFRSFWTISMCKVSSVSWRENRNTKTPQGVMQQLLHITLVSLQWWHFQESTHHRHCRNGVSTGICACWDSSSWCSWGGKHLKDPGRLPVVAKKKTLWSSPLKPSETSTSVKYERKTWGLCLKKIEMLCRNKIISQKSQV